MIARRSLLKIAAVGTLALALLGSSHVSYQTTGKSYSGTLTLLPTSVLSYLGHADFAFTSSDPSAIIEFACYQNGALVEGFGYMNPDVYHNVQTSFGLGPTGAWSGGAATCKADLIDFYSLVQHGKTKLLAPELTIQVSA